MSLAGGGLGVLPMWWGFHLPPFLAPHTFQVNLQVMVIVTPPDRTEEHIVEHTVWAFLRRNHRWSPTGSA